MERGWLVLRVTFVAPALSMAALLMVGVALGACDEDDNPAETTGVTGNGGAATSSATGMGGDGTGGIDEPIQCFPYANQVPTGECDLINQDCPEGFACVPAGLGTNIATSCMPEQGLKVAGDPCTGNAECRTGLICALGKCSPPCCPDNNEPCNGGECNVTFDIGPYETYYCTFLDTCQLYSQSPCDPGFLCYPLIAEGFAGCVPPSTNGPKTEGEACAALNDCAEFMVCESNVCQWSCQLDGSGNLAPGSGGCPAGKTCTDFGYALTGVGSCL